MNKMTRQRKMIKKNGGMNIIDKISVMHNLHDFHKREIKNYIINY